MSETPLPDALREARHTGRRILVAGVSWLVYELPAMVFDRRDSTSLIFESEGAVRRVWEFPPHWRDFSDDELLALSWSS